jgi:uncharacterized protein
MNHLIDGYNLLYALGRLSPRSTADALQGARRWLFELLRPAAVVPTSITVVFDSTSTAPGLRTQELASGVCFLYSRGQTADDLIEDLIETERSPRDLLVVSNDNRIKQAARHGKAQSIGCLDYYERFLMNPAVVRAEPPDKTTDEPEEITAEETEHWLQVFGEVDDKGKPIRKRGV